MMEGNVLCPCASQAGVRGLSGGASRAMTLLVVPRSMPRVLRIFMLPHVRGKEIVWLYCAGSAGTLPVKKSFRSASPVRGTRAGTVNVWDAETGLELQAIKGHSAQV